MLLQDLTSFPSPPRTQQRREDYAADERVLGSTEFVERLWQEMEHNQNGPLYLFFFGLVSR